MTKQTIQCPDCNGTTFHIHREDATVDVRDLGPIEYVRFYTECSNCEFQFVTPQQARDHDRQIKENGPYITIYVVDEDKLYNPKFGDDRICTCGHSYYRHFDTYEEMRNVGCKYCPCSDFHEAVAGLDFPHLDDYNG